MSRYCDLLNIYRERMVDTLAERRAALTSAQAKIGLGPNTKGGSKSWLTDITDKGQGYRAWSGGRGSSSPCSFAPQRTGPDAQLKSVSCDPLVYLFNEALRASHGAMTCRLMRSYTASGPYPQSNDIASFQDRVKRKKDLEAPVTSELFCR